ncbi:uncharacterized protein BKA78DRAFT_303185 [Phyllosticta capitalensis]|uniref:uncharacterized protein n=1 Tax=Phyllosticta capitalensis TaxID=121624 RepID=UPI0031329423
MANAYDSTMLYLFASGSVGLATLCCLPVQCEGELRIKLMSLPAICQCYAADFAASHLSHTCK